MSLIHHSSKFVNYGKVSKCVFYNPQSRSQDIPRSRLASLRGGCEANHGRDVGKLHLRPEAEGLQKQTDKSVRRVYVGFAEAQCLQIHTENIQSLFFRVVHVFF